MKFKTFKGQVTFINLIAIFISIIVFLILTPVVIPIMDGTANYLNSYPNQFSVVTIPLIYLSWPMLLVAIIITAIYYARPTPEYSR